jgi:RimJ/RimL family protein N-acetyltransferase
VTLPSFTTLRLLIRPRTLMDTEACLEMDKDPEVVRFVDGPWNDPAAHRAFIEVRTSGPYPEGLGYWTLLDRDKRSFLGWALLIPLDAHGPQIEIGWRLRRACWGRGYASEAAGVILRHGFATLGLDEIVAEIDPANIASVRVAEKIGMQPVLSVPRPAQPRRSYTRYLATRKVFERRITMDSGEPAPSLRGF